MNSAKQTIKNILAYILYYSGLLYLYRISIFKDHVVVLMYHRVLSKMESNNSFSNSSIIVNTSTFKKQINFLKNNFSIITPSSLNNSNTCTNKLPKYKCLITFDDGWVDNYINAFPILADNRVPATIFLPLDYIGNNDLFWQEKLSRLMYQLLTQGNSTNLLNKYFPSYNTETNYSDDELKSLIQETIINIKSLNNYEIDQIVNNFERALIKNEPVSEKTNIDQYMNWEQILEMRKSGIYFGSHACSHRILTKLNDDQAQLEISESKLRLEEKFNEPITTIAYPNGNYNETIKSYTRKCGYNFGFSTDRGYFSSGEDHYQIKRINIHEAATPNIPRFFCRILGIF